MGRRRVIRGARVTPIPSPAVLPLLASWLSNLIFPYLEFSSTFEYDTKVMRRYRDAKMGHPAAGDGIGNCMASCNDTLIDHFCIEPTSPPPTSVVLSLVESAQSTDSTLLLSLPYICLCQGGNRDGRTRVVIQIWRKDSLYTRGSGVSWQGASWT
jgi:hypothetical protein